MAQINRYFRCSKISEAKFRQLVRCFALDLTASQSAAITGLSVRSVNAIFLRMRRRIAAECERHSPFPLVPQVEDSCETAYGSGRNGNGSHGKSVVFGLRKQGDKVYAEIVPSASKAALQAVIRGKASAETVRSTPGWRGYDSLVDLALDRHVRVNEGETQRASGIHHVNGIESFWSFAKRRLLKFHGIPGHTFHLHLKETEFRFNHSRSDLYMTLLSLLRNHPL